MNKKQVIGIVCCFVVITSIALYTIHYNKVGDVERNNSAFIIGDLVVDCCTMYSDGDGGQPKRIAGVVTSISDDGNWLRIEIVRDGEDAVTMGVPSEYCRKITIEELMWYASGAGDDEIEQAIEAALRGVGK